jgi:hypothetical protein
MNARKWMFSLIVVAILVLAGFRPMAASALRHPRSSQTLAPQISPAFPEAGRMLGSIPLPLKVDRDTLLAFDSIWLIDGTTTGTLTRWDLVTRRTLAIIQVGNPFLTPYGDPVTAVATSEAVWVTSVATHELVRIDPANNQIFERIPLGQVDGKDFITYAMVGNDQVLFAWDYNRNLTLRIDLTTRQVGPAIPRVRPERVADGALWAWDAVHPDLARNLLRIDLTGEKVLARIPLDKVDPNKPLPAHSLWFAAGAYVYRVDPAADQVVAKIDAGATAYHVTDAGNTIWVTISPDPAACRDLNQGAILRIDPGTNSIVGETSLECPSEMLPYDNNLWVMNNYSEGNGQNVSRFSILQP